MTPERINSLTQIIIKTATARLTLAYGECNIFPAIQTLAGYVTIQAMFTKLLNLRRLVLCGLVLIVMIVGSGCAAGGLGGSATSDSGSDSDASGSNALFEGGPIDIPINIAKLDSPNPEKINVTLGSSNNLTVPGSKGVLKQATTTEAFFTCQDGAVPDPDSTPFLYVLDVTTGEEQFIPADSAGKCGDFTSNCPTLLASAVDDVNSAQMSAPIFIQCDAEKEEYDWVMSNTNALVEGAMTIFNNTMTAALDNNASASLSAPLNTKAETTPSQTIYTLEVGGRNTELKTVSFEIDQMFSNFDQLVLRSGNKIYNWNAADKDFDLIYQIDDAESIERIMLNDKEGDSDSSVTPYLNELYVQTNQSITLLNLVYEEGGSAVPGDFTTLLEFEACESVKDAYFDRDGSLVVNFYSTCDDEAGTSVGYQVTSAGNVSEAWVGAWDNKVEMWSSSSRDASLQITAGSGDYNMSVTSQTFSEGDTADEIISGGYVTPTLTVAENNFEVVEVSDPDTVHTVYVVKIISGDDTNLFLLGSQADNGTVGAQISAAYTWDGEVATPIITGITNETVYHAEMPVSDVAFVAYCSPISEDEARLHIFLPPDGDIVVLDEQICTANNNWHIDPISGNLVVAHEETIEGSSVKNYNVQFLDPDCDLRFKPNLPALIESGEADCEAGVTGGD